MVSGRCVSATVSRRGPKVYILHCIVSLERLPFASLQQICDYLPDEQEIE